MQDNKSDFRTRTRSQPRHPKPPFVGVGGKIEDKVDEAQDPWLIIEAEYERLREEEGSGITFLKGTAEEADDKLMSALHELKLIPQTAMKEEER